MKRQIIFGGAMVLILAISLSIPMNSAVAQTGFSGAWLLNRERSEGLPSGMNQVMTVARNGNVIRVKTKLITEQGEQTVIDVYKMNGRETEFSAQAAAIGAASSGRRVARWATDGMGIEVHELSTVDTPNGFMTVEVARRWTISADGKSLTIKMTVKGPRGNQQNKRIFVRK